MPSLSEEALQTLTCSVCKKYLSVFPVKVFLNKNIKCGRCYDDEDGGTTSHLYELVAKQLEFPCINRFEGCKEVLLSPEMGKHESTCYSNELSCPFCCFNGSSYDLLYHMKINHKKMALENNFFLIEKDQGRSSETYFYCKNSFFGFVGYQYDADSKQLSLSLELLESQHKSQQNIMHQFLLYSVPNTLQYKTGKIVTKDSGEKTIDLSEHNYHKNIIVCKFQVWELAVKLSKYKFDQEHANIQCDFPPVMDISTNKALLKFKFEEVSKFEIDVEYFSVAEYWVGNRLWKLNIKKIKENDECFLSVYLYKEPDKLLQSCNVVLTITLISFTAKRLHHKYCFNKKKFYVSWGWPEYLCWDDFINPIKGYLKNDSAYFEVLIEVSQPEEVKCDGCNVPMVCSKCNK